MRTNQSAYASLQRLAWVPVIVGCALMVAGWVPYLAATLGNCDVLHQFHEPTALAQTLYLWVGVGLSIASVPIMLQSRKRHLALAHRGIRVEGRPIKLGGAAVNGLRPVTFAFIVNGEQRTITKDTPDFQARQYNSKTRVTVIYDPSDPSNTAVLHDPTPASTAPTFADTIKENPRDYFERFLVAGVLFVSIFVSFGLSRLITGEMPGSLAGPALICLAAALAGGAKITLEARGRRNINWLNDFRWHYTITGVLLIAAIALGAMAASDNAREKDRFAQENAKRASLQAASDQYLLSHRPPPNSIPTSLAGTYTAPADSSIPKLTLYLNGAGVITLSGVEGKQADFQGAWTHHANQITFKLSAAMEYAKLPPNRWNHVFAVENEGRNLRHADGVLEKQ